MNSESSFGKSSRPKLPISLEALTSETKVHGLGFEHFSPTQKKDLESLLSSFGSSLNDPILNDLFGESLMNMMEYVKTPQDQVNRASLRARIKTEYEAAVQRYIGRGDEYKIAA